MANRRLLDITPGYPLRENELWVANKSETESGIMIRNSPSLYPLREWDVRWGAGERTAKAEPIRDIVNYSKTNGLSFFWKEAFRTTRNRIYVATGTGAKRLFLLPVKDWDFLTVRVNGTEVYEGADYDILFESGQNGLDVISFHDFVAAGQLVELDYTNGHLYPLVRAEYLDETLLPAGYNYHDLDITLRETKEDRSGIDIDEDISLFMPLKGSTQAAIKSLDKGTGSATFTRATTGTFLGSNGLIQQAASGDLRVEWGEGKNIVGPSEPTQLSDLPVDSGVTITDYTWPIGFFSKAVVFGDNSVSRWAYLTSYLKNGDTYTFSVYVVMDDGGLPVAGSNTSGYDFALVIDNSMVSGATVDHIGRGVYRVSSTKTVTTGGFSRNAGVVKYSSNGPRTFKVIGYQLERGSTPTRYVKTSTALPLVPLGVLIEGQRTNLFIRSEEFNDAAWVKGANVSVTPNDAAAPDGATTADRVSAISTSDYTFVRQARSVTSGEIYAVSVFVKKGNYRYIGLRPYTYPGTHVVFDMDTNTFPTTGTAEVLGYGFQAFANGWYRVWAVGQPSVTETRFGGVCISNSSGSEAPTLSGGEYFWIWGAQSELAGFSSSYIPTTSGTVTRNQDELTVPQSGNFNPSVGSCAAVFRLNAENATGANCIVTGANQGQLLSEHPGMKIFINDGTQTVEPASGPGFDLLVHKAASRWGGSSMAVALDGGTITQGSFDGAMDSGSTLRIGDYYSSNYPLSGHMKHLRIWSRALTDAEMQAVTNYA